jgi:hypothetical protein
LYSVPKAAAVYGWLFAPGKDTQFALAGLAAGSYVVQWYDPWTGEAVPRLTGHKINVNAKGMVEIDAAEALKVLGDAVADQPFPTKSRLARGQDAAFKIQQE